MDPFSLGTGIAGLLSLSIEITKILTAYVDGVKNYPRGIKELSEKLATLNQVLQQLVEFLRTENTKGASFDRTSTLCFASNACHEQLQRIFDRLAKDSKENRVLQGLKWPFTEAENLQTVETLHGYIQIFHFSLTIDGCALLSRISDDVSKALTEQLEELQKVTELSKIHPNMSDMMKVTSEASGKVSAILATIATFPDVSKRLSNISQTMLAVDQQLESRKKERLDEKMLKQREAVLEWLSPVTFNKRHHAIRALRQPNTGKWFLETKEFKEWLGSDTSAVLWCPGVPGAGKAVMTSTTIDYLAESDPSQCTGIAYLYCDYKDTGLQTSVTLAN